MKSRLTIFSLVKLPAKGRTRTHVSRRPVFMNEDGGFSTIGMVIALFITLALLLSASQVYRINEQSATLQDVADVSALAAQDQVANFITVARVCDATLLSMAITGTITGVLGVAALCTPATAPYSADLITKSKAILSSRDDFANTAAENLNRWQKLLPFLACNAALLCSNANSTASHSYYSIAITSPLEGTPISFSSGLPSSIFSDIEQHAKETKDDFSEAEDSSETLEKSKYEAWLHDCGYIALGQSKNCQYERAQKLASLKGTANTMQKSVDVWDFSKAITRARNYYSSRLLRERPLDNTIEEQSNSAIRSAFYTYAYNTLQEQYVRIVAGTYDNTFPLLPRNLTELRKTDLYYQASFPVTKVGDVTYMHSCTDCPAASGSSRYGSVAEMETYSMSTCPLCHFSIMDVANVASATTNTETGFEYHYRIISDCAAKYQKAQNGNDKELQRSKDTIIKWIKELISYLETLSAKRIDPNPPGSDGVIVITIDLENESQPNSLTSFVHYSGNVGTRIALSAATLAEDEASFSESVIADLLDGISQNDNALTGIANMVLSLWNAILYSYGQGVTGISDAAQSAFNKLPWESHIGLGTWISSVFLDALSSMGLQPATLSSAKPVLASSASIAASSDSEYAARFLTIQKTVLVLNGGAQSIAALLTNQESSILSIQSDGSATITIATLYPLGKNGPSIPITIALPKDSATSTVFSGIDFAFQTIIDALTCWGSSDKKIQRWS